MCQRSLWLNARWVKLDVSKLRESLNGMSVNHDFGDYLVPQCTRVSIAHNEREAGAEVRSMVRRSETPVTIALWVHTVSFCSAIPFLALSYPDPVAAVTW